MHDILQSSNPYLSKDMAAHALARAIRFSRYNDFASGRGGAAGDDALDISRRLS
jgi:hypothetical protein